MSRLKLVPTIIVKWVLRVIYSLCCIFPPKQNKITFASYRSEEMKGNLGQIEAYIQEHYPKMKNIYLLQKMGGSLLGKVGYIIHMFRASYHLATSRYFFIDDYYFLVYAVKPRKSVQVIQLWHSAGALKKFGYSTIDKPYGPSRNYLKHIPIHGNYTKVFVSSNEVIPYFAEAFNMDSKNIYQLGIPRTDYFFDEKHKLQALYKFQAIFPLHENKKKVLYAPTYRGGGHNQKHFEMPIDIHKFTEELGEDYLLMIHLHPYMKYERTKFNSSVIFIDDDFTIEELLIVAHILVTDYSSIIFDFSILEKPMIFFAYDLEEYRAERDFYYNYEETMPGPIVKTNESLFAAIKQSIDLGDTEDVKQFKQRYFDYNDGQATERIVRNIISGE
ncbi:CDP-glycerol glycerophosphotransferase family protein [Oceanobacillus kimchii]|uniref:CDP-glycerol glycerophosphotransferase family protein n=1 Tax=Oceanobacillus kimchii TaxID=746691 RepID=UPI00158B7911|nr:CDP-glycerol glycerophosphotransferase family protein [Oceanobacillus kimchii]